MFKRFPLQSLLDLAQLDSDTAAARLGASNGHERDMEQRLQMLLEYRSEYSERMARVTQTGMHSVDLRNFREFIDKIDAAIELQRELVAKARIAVEAGQLHWHSQRRKLRSFDTLSQRHSEAARVSESRQEQKEQDELAVKSFLDKPIIMG